MIRYDEKESERDRKKGRKKRRKKKGSSCTMKAVVLKLTDMIGVVGRLRTKHD